MSDPAWSEEVNGLRFRCVTDRADYAPTDKISLQASYRNTSDRPLVILVNGNSMGSPGPPQFDMSPLYSVERLNIEGQGRRMEIRAIWSNMFIIHAYRTLGPGEEYTERALLSTPFWEGVDDREENRTWLRTEGDREPCLPCFGPGGYRLKAVYALPGIPAKTLQKMKAFMRRPEADRDVDAFFRAKIQGFSYRDMLQLAEQEFNLWAGRVISPAVSFEVRR